MRSHLTTKADLVDCFSPRRAKLIVDPLELSKTVSLDTFWKFAISGYFIDLQYSAYLGEYGDIRYFEDVEPMEYMKDLPHFTLLRFERFRNSGRFCRFLRSAIVLLVCLSQLRKGSTDFFVKV